MKKISKGFYVNIFFVFCMIFILISNSELVLAWQQDKEIEVSLNQEGTEMPTPEQLLFHDYIVYLVNCGTGFSETVPAGYQNMGLYQSNVEQSFGEDEVTGKKWGYYENRPSIAYANRTFNGSKLTDSKRYNYGASTEEYQYQKGVSGIYYHFELPNGIYHVKLGFYNDWSVRPVDIVLEGETVESNVSLSENRTVEKKYAVEVKDGELNVKVHNPGRTDQYGDALLSYIIVEVPVSYNAELLKAAVKEYSLTEEEKSLYDCSSLEKYEEAWYYADKVANDPLADGFSEEKIKSYYNKLKLKYDYLIKKEEPETYSFFTGTNGALWKDTDGTEIQAHGGQVQQFTYRGETKYYWYGEDKTDGYRTVDGGVRVYSSSDLYNWENEGVAMRNLTDIYDFEETYFDELYGDKTLTEKEEILDAINDSKSVIERPKVIYNEKTEKYVMWFHADGPLAGSSSNYGVASAGVAVSDTPTGPFKYLGRHRLHYVQGAYDQNKGMARDMNLFVDDDGTGYIIYSSEENATLFISKLNDAYTYLSAEPEDAKEGVDFIRSSCFAKQHREAPAPFKYNGRYYMLTSGTEGWAATQSRYAVADSMLGEWKEMGDPCVGDGSVTEYPANKTFGSQSTNVFPVDAANGKFIYMGDRWNGDAPLVNSLKEPKYIWLPVEFGEDGKLVLRPYADWTLDELENKGEIKICTSLPDVLYIGKSLDLPGRIDVAVGTEEKTTDVIWDTSKLNPSIPGKYPVTGTLTDLISAGSPRKITIDVIVAAESAAYIVNSGAKENVWYADYERLVEENYAKLHNQNTADQAFTGENQWGYSSTGEIGIRSSSGDMYESLLYVKGDLTYSFSDLPEGNYNVYVGYYDPWSEWADNRNVDVILNGKKVDSSRYITSKKQGIRYQTSVTETGVLKLDFVRKTEYDTLVSWIIIDRDWEEGEAIEADKKEIEEFAGNWNLSDEEEMQEFLLLLETENGSHVSWESSHESIKIENNKGIVTLLEEETVVTLTASITRGTESGTLSISITVPARKGEGLEILVESISLNKTSYTLKGGEQYTFQVTYHPDTATNKDLIWSSSDESIATVDGNGKVTALSAGTASITAKTNNDKTASCELKVTAKENPDDKKDREAAKAVENLIANIGSVSYSNSSRDKINAAKKAYNALSDTQKKLVKNHDVLEKAEEQYTLLKGKAEEIKQGKTYTVGKYKYRVTNLKKKTVKVVGVTNKKIRAIKVKDKVKIKGKTFKINAIGKNAFKNCKEANRAIIGKNVKTIENNAFYGCKKLKNITIKGKIKTVKKTAFKGTQSQLTIKVPVKKSKYYKNLLKNKGLKKTARIK